MTTNGQVTYPQAQPAPPPAPAAGYSDSENLRLIQEAVRRLAPEQLDYIIYPNNGEPALLPAGTTIIDLKSQTVISPASSTSFPINTSLIPELRSIFMAVDTDITVELQPGTGKFPGFPGALITANYRKTERIILNSDTPFSIFVVVSTGLQAGGTIVVVRTQDRFANVTLTKGVAVNSVEGLSNTARAISFIVQTDDASLAQSFGVNFIRTTGIGQKMFAIRNVGPGAVDCQLFGTVYVSTPPLYQGLAGGNDGWVADPDMLRATGGIPLNIPSGQNGVIESGVPWYAVQLRARLASGEVLGQTANLLVEYLGSTPGVR